MEIPSGWGSGWVFHLDGNPIGIEVWMGTPFGWGSGWESDVDGMNPMWMGFRMGIPSGWNLDGDLGWMLEAGFGMIFLTFITVHWSLRLKYR